MTLTRLLYTHVRWLIGAAISIFCLRNVYHSLTSSQYVSSHAYLENALPIDQRHRDVVNHSASDEFRRRRWEALHDREAYLGRLKPLNEEDFPPYDVVVNGTRHPVPLWQRRLAAGLGTTVRMTRPADVDDALDNEVTDETYCYLVALLQVRIYSEDKGKWSVRELKQWLHYQFLAGVDHVVVCDHFASDAERLESHLHRYVSLGLVTYLAWNSIRHPMTSQQRCYQRIINRYKHLHAWQIAIDIDEYPFMPNDTTENFLVRYLATVPDEISEVSLANYLMLGRGNRSGLTVVERIDRMTPRPANELVKPIYRPRRVRASVHHNHLLSGRHIDAPSSWIRMLHYWGARVQEWGEDTQRTLNITVPMDAMRWGWGEKLRNSLMVFGELDALGNDTGP